MKHLATQWQPKCLRRMLLKGASTLYILRTALDGSSQRCMRQTRQSCAATGSTRFCAFSCRLCFCRTPQCEISVGFTSIDVVECLSALCTAF